MRRLRLSLLALLAALTGGTAQAAWHEASSAHFVVYSDDDVDDVREYATNLEKFDKAMRVMRALPDEVSSPSQRVTVFVLRDLGAIRKLSGSDSVAGFYNARVEGSVAFVPRTGGGGGKLSLTGQAVLLHEYAHHFMFATWGKQAFPAWLVEGFAEFNATAIFEPEQLLVGAMPLYRAYGLIDTRAMRARALLTQSPQTKKMTDYETQVFNGRSWLLTHYLTLGKDRGTMLTDYLAALNAGKSAIDAASVFGDLRTLDDKLDRYATQRRLTAIGVKSSALPIGPIAVRALSAAEVAIMPVRLRSTRSVTPKTALDIVGDARRIAATYPADAAVQVALAEAEYDAGMFEAADAAAARAIAARPGFGRALMYRGMAQEAIARRGKVTDPARWLAVRRWFRQANRIDIDDPWPLVAFYRAFPPTGEPVSANAEAGLVYAYTLAPFDRRLAFEVAAVHVRHRRYAEASIPLRRIAYDPHGGGMAAAASALLTAIESNDTATLERLTDAKGPPDEGAGKDGTGKDGIAGRPSASD